jgi:hypothetical protein
LPEKSICLKFFCREIEGTEFVKKRRIVGSTPGLSASVAASERTVVEAGSVVVGSGRKNGASFESESNYVGTYIPMYIDVSTYIDIKKFYSKNFYLCLQFHFLQKLYTSQCPGANR